MNYAGFWQRFFAFFIDYILCIVVRFFFGYNLAVVIIFLYFVIMPTTSIQGTVGKMVMGIIITDMDGQRIEMGKSVIRQLAAFISMLLLFIGYIIQPFTAQKQALHDIIAGTLVLKR